jgi:hypothetical protein
VSDIIAGFFTVTGDIDGVNRNFVTETPFATGTLRGVVNGITYPIDDENFGITEISDTEFQFNVAPKVGFIVQAFYSEIPVVGSPYDPDHVLP